MNSMIQQVSSLNIRAAQSAAAVARAKAPEVQQPEAKAPVRSRVPVVDEYIPEEKQEPSGRYWLGRDEDGQPRICFDAPKRAADEPKQSTERCICSTDQVDREIEALKKNQERLEQQISSQTDEAKIRALEQKLARVERELSQKDNDGYRRQHAVFS